MVRSRRTPSLLVVAVPLLLLIVAGLGYLIWRQTVAGVHAELQPAPRFVGVKTPVTLDLRAPRGGIETVEVRIVQGATAAVVAQQSFSPAPAEQRLQLVVAGRDLKLQEGPATIEVRARDGFWRPWRGREQRPVLTAPVTIDFTPPTLEVLAATHYLHQGGGGLAALRVKDGSRVGVKVGEQLFPAYPAGDASAGLQVVLFALPWNLPDATPITAWAEDEAGNGVARPLPSELRPRRFPHGTVDISDRFLASKLPELLPEKPSVPPGEQLDAFLIVNRDKRKQAEDMKREVATHSRPTPLWQGAFIQPRNTKVFSNFAETRQYRYNGREIDTQVHLGYDLASLKNSPVPAANSGVVAFAGPLTIYGNAVILDHGLGLQTLYGHLSTIEVKPGAEVKQGQELGRTGTTGLAVGDHLHFEVLIHGVSVTPVEWWDGKWIRDHIGRPLKEANVPLLQSEFPADRGEKAEKDAAATAAKQGSGPVRKTRAARAR